MKWKVSQGKSVKRELQSNKQSEWSGAQISSRLIWKLCNEGVYCIYLASAVRCRSDRQAGQAKQHAQIARTEVTLSGQSVICNNNSLSIPVDLWQTHTMALHTPCFFQSQVQALRLLLCANLVPCSLPLQKRYLLMKKKEQRMNYCQRLLRVLILALVQIYSMQEQSTLRNISQSVLCSTRHETQLTKHCKMCNGFHFTTCNMTVQSNLL